MVQNRRTMKVRKLIFMGFGVLLLLQSCTPQMIFDYAIKRDPSLITEKSDTVYVPTFINDKDTAKTDAQTIIDERIIDLKSDSLANDAAFLPVKKFKVEGDGLRTKIKISYNPKSNQVKINTQTEKDSETIISEEEIPCEGKEVTKYKYINNNPETVMPWWISLSLGFNLILVIVFFIGFWSFINWIKDIVKR